MPLVSIIIPVFNGEKTIKQTIESVLQQTVADFELMVINDGSTDNTLSVISQINDSRLNVFSYANAGLAASRNRGISQATGKYISFIDADDLWRADKLEAQIKALEANPQAGVAYSWTDWIDESGQFLRPGGHIIANGNVYNKLLLRDFVEGGSNVLVLAKAFAEVGGFDESLNAVEDWEMWLRLAAPYEFVCVPSAQILYRISPHSMSTDVWKMEAASLRVIERALAQAPEPLDYLKRQVLAERYKYFTFKAIEGRLERRRGLTAMRFFGQVIIHDPIWLLRPKIISIVLLKIALATIFPSQPTYALLKNVKR